MQAKEKELTRPEASLVSRYFQEHNISLEVDWMDLWRVTPSAVAAKYGVELSVVLKACRRSPDGNKGA